MTFAATGAFRYFASSGGLISYGPDRRIECDIDVAGEQALHGQSSAAVGHELNADADRTARAQQAAMPVIGYLGSQSPDVASRR